MPANTNAHGDIFGGWLVSQMDLAGSIAAGREAQGRVATVAIDKMNFMVPVKVGAIVSCYSAISSVGRSSIEVNIEVWVSYTDNPEQNKVTEGVFVFVAIDQNGRTRQLN
jgi:acyl-CoA thioesterase YciA